MQVIADRRCLHRIPELDFFLPETLAYLRASLENLNCSVFSPIEGALCAWFDFGAGDAIAFRCDIDALPITEQNDIPYASAHPGRMHACGHDAHAAMVLELARRLSKKKTLGHNVLLIFQPAEETTGGAKPICETGIFETYQVQAIFGLHLWPGLAKGKIFTRKNELMARSCEVTVDIYGRSSHIAKASEGIDALMAGAEFYRRALQMEQALPDSVFRLLKFGKFHSGTVRNALSAHTHVEGSLRAFQEEWFDHLSAGLDAIGADLEDTFGCRVVIHRSSGYPAVLNPEDLFVRAAACAEFTELDAPFMTAEDFSWYQRYVPGMFFFLGAGDAPPLHADTFDFDESILPRGADFLEALAENFR